MKKMSLYEILGVDQNATQEEIKKAYKKLANKHHPDKDGDKEKFQAIQEAYGILSNAEKRNHYNETGQTKAEPTLDQISFTEFLKLLTRTVNQTDPAELSRSDIATLMRQEIQKQISDKKQIIEKIPEAVEHLKAAIPLIKKDHNGILEHTINQRIKIIEAQKEHEKRMIELLEHMFDHFDKFKYEYQRELTLDNFGYRTSYFTFA